MTIHASKFLITISQYHNTLIIKDKIAIIGL